MAQSFSITFPKFWFDVQKDLELTFADRDALPFEILQDDRGHIFVQQVLPPPTQQGGEQQTAVPDQLVAGLHIININGEDITGIAMDYDKFQEMIGRAAGTEVTFQFREDIEDDEDQRNWSSLGLAAVTEMEEERKSSDQQLRQQTSTSFRRFETSRTLSTSMDTIEDKHITATSCIEGHEAHQCRLNGPSCWKPRQSVMSSLIIDLRIQKQVTMLQIQGNSDHTEFCRTIWIDHSNDGAEWFSWSKIEIKLVYDNKGIATVRVWPVLLTRFVRIRPAQWQQRVALRMELLGLHSSTTTANQRNARVITLSEIDPQQRAELLRSTANLPPTAKVIQMDCRQIIKHALNISGVTEVSFIRCQISSLMMAVFSTKDGEESERVLDNLTDVGVGKQLGTISVMGIEYRSEHRTTEHPAHHQLDIEKYKENKSSFTKSVKSRKFVQTMIDRIMGNATLTFDYVVMLIVASLIALGGLATDNSVVVVASMLGLCESFSFSVCSLTIHHKNMHSLSHHGSSPGVDVRIDAEGNAHGEGRAEERDNLSLGVYHERIRIRFAVRRHLQQFLLLADGANVWKGTAGGFS